MSELFGSHQTILKAKLHPLCEIKTNSSKWCSWSIGLAPRGWLTESKNMPLKWITPRWGTTPQFARLMPSYFLSPRAGCFSSFMSSSLSPHLCFHLLLSPVFIFSLSIPRHAPPPTPTTPVSPFPPLWDSVHNLEVRSHEFNCHDKATTPQRVLNLLSLAVCLCMLLRRKNPQRDIWCYRTTKVLNLNAPGPQTSPRCDLWYKLLVFFLQFYC